jgi:predicted ATP-dependent serine protease
MNNVPRSQVQYKCSKCGNWLETEARLYGTTERCPVCKQMNTVPESRETRRFREQWEEMARREEDAHARAVRDKEQQLQIQRREHEIALRSGKVFDADILATAFKDDWVRIQKDTGLTPLEISQGVKQASPAVGIGAGPS